MRHSQCICQEYVEKVMQMLKVRILTAILMSIATVIALVFSYIPYVTNIVVMMISAVGIYELFRAAKADKNRTMLMCSLGCNLLICMLPMTGYPQIVTVVFFGTIFICIRNMKMLNKYSFSDAYQAFAASGILMLFMRSIITLREAEGGLWFVVLAILVCVITDSAAYLFGRKYGKHRLASLISPNKTVEGSIAGMISTVIILTTAAMIAEHLCELQFDYGYYIVYLMMASVVAQFGDLALSMIKRMAGIKDYGRILPGHGGMLDRIDSVVFVMPFTLIYVWFISLLPVR